MGAADIARHLRTCAEHLRSDAESLQELAVRIEMDTEEGVETRGAYVLVVDRVLRALNNSSWIGYAEGAIGEAIRHSQEERE